VSFLGEFLWLYLRCDGPVGREGEVDRREMGWGIEVSKQSGL
jgi:hypothetical protein